MQGTEQPTYRQFVGGVAEIAIPIETTGPLEEPAPRSADSRAYATIKRGLDIAGALALTIVAAPLVAAAAATIMATSGRPVFYRQTRAGRDGVPFTCWKLRTMVPQAEDVLAADTLLAATYLVNFKIDADPRVTRIGRFLRKTSIDELPQLWNILRGDMSLVGPRPVTLAEYASKYGPLGRVVFSVRPGLTGLWQVSGRSRIDYADRISLDLEYIRTRSIRRDLKIMLLTPLAILRGGA